MPTMAVEKSPPDPPPPVDASRSAKGQDDPPFQGDSFDIDGVDFDPDLNTFEIGVVVGQSKTMKQHFKGPRPIDAVADALRLILEHFPDVTIYLHITKKPLPPSAIGAERAKSDWLDGVADLGHCLGPPCL